MKAIAGTVLAALAVFTTVAGAADYPVKPIRIIVPSTPGATLDFTARVIAEPLSRRLKQPVIVENKPGAGSTLGTAQVVRSDPDGYTLLAISSAHTSMPIFMKDVPFDVLKDLTPVSEVMTGPLVMLGANSAPAKTLPALIAYAKSNPGKLNYATTGSADPLLAFVYLTQQTGTQIVHVPYAGGAQVVQSVVAGETQMAFTNVLSGVQITRDKRALALAVSGTARIEQLPDTPTLEEMGYKGFDNMTNFGGIVAPAGTPKEIVNRLSSEIARIVREPETIAAIKKLGAVPVGGTPEQLGKLLTSSVEKWSKVAREAGLKPQ